MSRYLNCSLLVGVALLTSACVVTQEEFRSLQQDVRGMRVEMNAIAKKEGVSDGEEWGTSATDMVARLEELSVETRMIQGKLEENSHRLSELSQRLDQTEMKVAGLRGEPVRPGGTSVAGQPAIPSTVPPPPVPGTGPHTAPPGATARPGVSTPSSTGQPLPPSGQGLTSPQHPAAASPGQQVMQGSMPSPQKVYRDGLSDYTKGNYDLAIQSFKTYLTFFPKTSLVPNAQYWLAESYYSKREFLRAIREFDKLVNKYPESPKVPSAMLKQGYAYLELGEPAQGQGVLRELVAKFPRSREARLAQDRMERL